jgi:DNA-3-methyladenine glycosylase
MSLCLSDPLPREFYARDAVEVAQAILGTILVHRTARGIVAGRIVEAEAYTQDDPASHAYAGMTPRNAVMFGEPGHAYVYFTYGMYYCLNTSTGPLGFGSGVLIRAVEPIAGIEMMKNNRKTGKLTNLASGPGKLCQAFGLDRRHNGLDLTDGELTIHPGDPPGEIASALRIGIRLATDKPWRFYIKDNPFVSKK